MIDRAEGVLKELPGAVSAQWVIETGCRKYRDDSVIVRKQHFLEITLSVYYAQCYRKRCLLGRALTSVCMSAQGSPRNLRRVLLQCTVRT